MIKTSLINLILRGLTLISKFFLMFFIARYLTPEDLGVWGLMNISISVSLLIIGMDFYVFNTREILAVESSKFVPYLRDQMVFHGLVYLVVLPLLLVVFLVEIISWKYIGWFYVLLILEHLSQETVRLLITLSRPNMSNFILFFRSGAWVYIVVSLLYFDQDLRNLPNIWCGWIIGVSVSIIISIFALRKLPWKVLKNKSIDWAWIKKGMKISLPFLIATISFMGTQNIDRYFLKLYWGEAYVGIYTFYFSITNVIHIAIFTGIIMILYPKLIVSFQKSDFSEYKSLMKKMALGITGGLVVLIIIALILIEPVLHLIGKQIYAENINLFYLMLINTSLLTFAYIPHYSLFVRKWDKSIIVSTLIAFAVALVANILLVPKYGLLGAAYATMMAMGTMLVLKGLMVMSWERSPQNDKLKLKKRL